MKKTISEDTSVEDASIEDTSVEEELGIDEEFINIEYIKERGYGNKFLNIDDDEYFRESDNYFN